MSVRRLGVLRGQLPHLGTVPYRSLVMAETTLLAYYRQGETSGTTLVDSSGNGHNGAYGTTKAATVGLLNGDTDGGAFQNSSVTTAAWMNVTSITVEALFLPTTLNNNTGVVARYHGQANWLLWCNTSNQLAVRFYNTTGSSVDLVSTTIPTTGVVYHLAATYQSGQARFYVNGTQVASSTALTGSLAANAVDLYLHNYDAGAQTATGMTDEVALYSGEQSATSIARRASLVAGA